MADGAGHLSTNGLLTRAETDVVPHVTVEALLIGRFSSCSDPNQVMGIAVDHRTPLFLPGHGQLFSRHDSVALDDFEPCEAWYLRLDYHAQAARVWRATDPEPDDWSIQGLDNDHPLRPLRVYAGRFAGSGGEVLIEVIDVTTEST